MLISPVQLAGEPLLFDETIPAGEIDYAPDIHQTGTLTVTGRAELILEHRGPREVVEDIRLRARFEGRFVQFCARCLEPVEQPIAGSFDLIFRPGGADAQSGEHAITEDETEIGYYDKAGLLLEDAVREQVLLSLPGRTLCREDCKGLCPHCGADRNRTPCDCDDRNVDPRLGALAAFSVIGKD